MMLPFAIATSAHVIVPAPVVVLARTWADDKARGALPMYKANVLFVVIDFVLVSAAVEKCGAIRQLVSGRFDVALICGVPSARSFCHPAPAE